MHQVRLVHGNVFIDELEFVSTIISGESNFTRWADIPSKHVSNLCSAFSYCLTLLGSCYVWHGKGSLPGERQAALGYALSLAVESSPVELVEQESDGNEMFWMMLGNDDYARADYWRWRPDLATVLPRIWRVDSSSAPYVRKRLDSLSLGLTIEAAHDRPSIHHSIKCRFICVPT
jgi:hypothetical protein